MFIKTPTFVCPLKATWKMSTSKINIFGEQFISNFMDALFENIQRKVIKTSFKRVGLKLSF